jgi:hypothetical protein
LADSDDWSSVGDYTSTLQVTAINWHLVGYIIDLQGDATNVNVTCFLNTLANSTSGLISNHIFVDDATAYKSFLGTHRTDQTTYEGDFKGFMYKFIVYNEAKSTPFGETNASCDPSCVAGATCTDVATECLEDYEFTETNDNVTCDGASCNDLSCVRTGECQTCDINNGKSGFCHLCFDREC